MILTWALLLIGAGCGAAAPLAATTLQPGDELSALLAAHDTAGLRLGLNGAPAGARGAIPATPSMPGAHWLVVYGPDNEVQRWIRFRIAGDAAATRVLEIGIDASPPLAVLGISGEQVQRDDRVIVGPTARFNPDVSDASGVAHSMLLIDGREVPDPAQWSHALPEGRHEIALRSGDALGNTGIGAVTPIELDSTPPRLEWTRLDEIGDLPADVFDGKRVRLALRVSDAAGLRSLTLGGHEIDPALFAEGAHEVSLRGNALAYRIQDRVGNTTEASLPLRIDTEGPQLLARRNGEAVGLNSASFLRTDTIELSVEDEPAGVARACVEASIWYGECRALPITLVGISPGRYSLQLLAADRLGNTSSRRFRVTVQP